MSEWTIIWGAREAFFNGFLKSIALFAYSAILGLLLGCVLLYLLEGRDNLARRGIKALINAMRTLPFLILAYLLYYGLPKFGLRMSADTAGLLALTVYHGAYFCEIFRSQRLVMPVGYIEAALAHGFRDHVIFLRILLPNVVMNTLPLIGNQLIICLKDTAFLSIITVREITAAANSVQSTYFIPLKAFLVAILLYWLISLVIDSAIKQVSRLGKKRGFNHA